MGPTWVEINPAAADLLYSGSQSGWRDRPFRRFAGTVEGVTRALSIDWARRYPPLAAVAAALLLLVFALPSALNLPQANPGQTLEYAPVPGNSTSAPPGGNLAGLGLAAGSGSGSGAAPGAPAQVPPGVADASPKACVGNPPRQTEDPLAPPCVSAYTGDNGGSTYQGVTGSEVRILFYFDCCVQYAGTSQGDDTSPTDTYYDLLAQPQGTEPVFVRILRGYQRYFNSRYQTYKRQLHFYVYYGSTGSDGNNDPTAEQRAADAEANYAKVKPFAVENFSTGNSQAYLKAMAQHGVLNYGYSALGTGVFAGHPESYFQQFPGLIWDFLPSLEHQAQVVSSWICQKIVPNPVSFAGDPTMIGQPRKLAMLSTTDPLFPDIQRYAALIQQEVSACGGQFVAYGSFPNACCGISDDYQYSVQNEAQFKKNGATTVIWGGGLENTDPAAATSIGYRPEWVLAGDRGLEGAGNAMADDQSQWADAWVVSNVTKIGPYVTQPCYQSWASVDSSAPSPASFDVNLACTMYDEIRELAIGIQISGPHLTPQNMDQGFHAIPHVASTDPTLPACYYETSDYTCVKDGEAMWWDPSGTPPNYNQKGCWRMAENGARYLPGQWPGGEPSRSSSNPCNGF